MKRPRSTLESPEVPAKRNCGCAVHPEPTSSLSLGYRIQERILTHYDYVECPSISNKEEEERYYNERNVAWCYNQAKGSVWKCTNKANYDHYTDEMLGREFVIKNVVWVGPHYHECATIVYNKIVGIRLDDSGRDQYVLEGVFRSFSAEHFRNMCVPLHYDDTTKGCGASLVIIDEAAYINKQLYDETIRALTNMRDCGMIAISTPLGPDNFVSILIDMKNDDGTPFYNVLRMTSVCEKCKLLPTPMEQQACRHTWLPSWKSQGKQERNRKVGAATGSTNVTAQEDCGLIIDGANGKIFSSEKLDRDFKIDDANKMYNYTKEKYIPSRIYMACDPNADRESNTAVCSCFWAPPANPSKILSIDKSGRIQTERGFEMNMPRLVYLCMDVGTTSTSANKDDMILGQLAEIRTMCNGIYAKVPVVFIPERGTGSFTTRCHEILRNVPSVETMREGGGELYGVYKSDVVSSGYIDTWNSLSDNGRIKFHSEFFTRSHAFVKEKETAYGKSLSPEKRVVGEWKGEMNRMRMIARKITGKGKDGGSNDDMAIAGMMIAYWSQQVENLNSECYQYLRNKVWVSRAQRGMNLAQYSLSFQDNLELYDVDDKTRKSINKMVPGLSSKKSNTKDALQEKKKVVPTNNKKRAFESKGKTLASKSRKLHSRDAPSHNGRRFSHHHQEGEEEGELEGSYDL